MWEVQVKKTNKTIVREVMYSIYANIIVSQLHYLSSV